MPIAFSILVKLYFQELNSENVKRRIGSMYEGLKTGSKLVASFNSFFLIKRLLFALLAIYSTDWPYFQIVMITTISLILLIFIVV